MKKPLTLLVTIALLWSCRKELPVPETTNPKTALQFTIADAQHWTSQNSGMTKLNDLQLDWKLARTVQTSDGARVYLPLKGQPTFGGVKQGYRQLSIEKDRSTGEVQGKILEIIPDATYFQEKQKVDSRDFTGRIFAYDLSYRFKSGTLYSQGKIIGESRPSTQAEKTAYLNGTTNLLPLGNFEQNAGMGASGKIALARVIETCVWYQTSYMDAEGVLTIYAEKICDYSFYDDGSGGGGGGTFDPGIGYEPPYGGGGSGGGNTGNPGPPAPSELPMENQSAVDPKKMMDCFATLPDGSAAFQVKVLVLEPQPGTSFNVGQNSFGHVAIQLTKASNNQIITQTIGFYPTGSGLDKLVSKSRMIDNGGLEYTMSATYWTDAESFKKLIEYVASPPANYHFTDFNCAAFVYNAGKAAGLPIPDPTTQIGFAGPGGAGAAMTPQGMAAALDKQKVTNPKSDISRSDGRAPASKGPCN
ncbi:hypothetical protein WG904_19410 [Pedobacter sp. Du54]|uniref:hypothetical protein n=1 Tax=Pedobacter anseongensis TaxID=3133439 RepID=UPI0030A7D2E3